MAKQLGPKDPFKLIIDRSALNRLLNSESSAIALDLAKRAQRVASSAKRRAPRKTGQLRSQIGFEVGSDEQGVYVDIVSPADSFQERGHRAVDGTRVAPRKYLRPALYAGRRPRRRG